MLFFLNASKAVSLQKFQTKLTDLAIFSRCFLLVLSLILILIVFIGKPPVSFPMFPSASIEEEDGEHYIYCDTLNVKFAYIPQLKQGDLRSRC